jgi:glycosyltransferase involved in cell wall biosynthesis
MDTKSPLVSVIMPVFNGEKYLQAAITSILEQTFPDFELIVVDDGSQDATPQIIAAQQDPRIVRMGFPANRGTSAARNAGIQIARGETIALADADDLHLPEQLERQVAFLEAHPEVGLLGTGMHQTQETTQSTLPDHFFPETDAKIRWNLCFRSSIIDTSAMVRRSVLPSLSPYDETMTVAMDYDLWVRLAPAVRFHNLPEALVTMRFYGQSTIGRNRDRMPGIASRIRQEMMAYYLGPSYFTGTSLLEILDSPERYARLIQQLYHRFKNQTALDAEESQWVRQQAAQKMFEVGRMVASRRAMVTRMARAVLLDPSLSRRFLTAFQARVIPVNTRLFP